VEQLQPFIVTSWHGHRDDPKIPPVVDSVWREKFIPRRGPGPATQSNVDLAVLDSKGRLIHWFDGFPHGDPNRRESLPQYTVRELRRAAPWLGLDQLPPRSNPLNLPDLEGVRGMRVFVRLMDQRMTAYQAPVVETVPLQADDWTVLAWPDENRSIAATDLTKWLSQVYPPGVMERTNPVTKEAYRIKSVAGTLSLVPANSDSNWRYATLAGDVRLTDDGEDGFSYDGRLHAVLTYKPSEPEVQSVRGVFEGLYPRTDRLRNRTFWIPIESVFESRP
jgi:hypothetical protein